MVNQTPNINTRNLRAFINDSIPLTESKDFGEWKGNGKTGETEEGEPIYQMPCVNYSSEVMKFLSSFHHNKLYIPFDRSDVPKYLEEIKDPNTDFSTYSIEKLLKMLSVIIDGDNIVEGTLLSYLESNGIQKILLALQKISDMR